MAKLEELRWLCLSIERERGRVLEVVGRKKKRGERKEKRKVKGKIEKEKIKNKTKEKNNKNKF